MESDWNHTSDYKNWLTAKKDYDFVNHEYYYGPTSDDTKFTYQLIIIFREAQEIKTVNEIIMLEYRVPDLNSLTTKKLISYM